MIVKETQNKLKFVAKIRNILSQYEDGYISFEDMVKNMFASLVLLIENHYEL